MHYMHLVLPRILDEGYILCSVHCLKGHYGIGAIWSSFWASLGASFWPSPRSLFDHPR